MSPLVGPLVALAAVVWLILIFRIVLVAARMFQIEEYESVRFLRWGLTREWLAHRAVWLGLLVGAVARSCRRRDRSASRSHGWYRPPRRSSRGDGRPRNDRW